MRNTLFSLIAIFSLLPLFSQEKQEIRSWTNTEGKTLKATFLSYDREAESVSLKLSTGKTISLKPSTLSEEDKQWLDKVSPPPPDPAELTKDRVGQITSIEGTDDYPTFFLYYPTKLDLKKAPPLLILFCPGGGGKGMVQRFQSACEEYGWAVIGCTVFRNTEDEQSSLKFGPLWSGFLAHLDSLVFYNPDRMYMGGMSGGGMRAYFNSEKDGKDARPWKGIIAMGGWLGRDAEKINCPTHMTVAMINGDKDGAARCYEERDSKILKRRQCKIKKFPFEGGHTMPPKEHLGQVLKWMDEECPKTSEQRLPEAAPSLKRNKK